MAVVIKGSPIVHLDGGLLSLSVVDVQDADVSIVMSPATACAIVARLQQAMLGRVVPWPDHGKKQAVKRVRKMLKENP